MPPTDTKNNKKKALKEPKKAKEAGKAKAPKVKEDKKAKKVKPPPGKAGPSRERCLICETLLAGNDFFAQYAVCPTCRFHYSMTARDRINMLADPDTFRETNRSVTSLDPLSFSSRVSYKERVFRDQKRTGLTEAAVTGSCTISGTPVVLIVLDFGFMGGSMGCVVGEKVALAFEHAVRKEMPVVAVVTSGGARIQEGVLSLMQMAKTSIAASQLNEKGIAFITVLANPSTGQVYASFANLADVIVAEPGAIVGVAPLRTIRKVTDHPLPMGSHTSEAHLEHGLVDTIADRTRLRDLTAALLDMLVSKYQLTAPEKAETPEAGHARPVAWDAVKLARHKERPTTYDYIGRIVTNFVELHGDRAHGDDPAVVAGIGDIGGQTVVIIGHERGRVGDPAERNGGRPSPDGYRKAQRAIAMARKFRVPLITLIDTPGSNASIESEEHGLGNAIATTMAQMAGLDAPSIAVIIGEGGSEAALALGVADRVLMLENAIYTVISPEDAASIIYRDEAKADEMAESLRLTAKHAKEMGIVDVVVPEPVAGAHTNPDETARELRRVLLRELAALHERADRKLVRERYKKYRKMGEYSSHFRSAVAREVSSLQGKVAGGVRRIARRSKKHEELDPSEWSAEAIEGYRQQLKAIEQATDGERQQ